MAARTTHGGLINSERRKHLLATAGTCIVSDLPEAPFRQVTESLADPSLRT